MKGDDLVVKGKLGEKYKVYTSKERFGKNNYVSQSTNMLLPSNKLNKTTTISTQIPRQYETESKAQSAVNTVKNKFDKIKFKNDIKLKQNMKSQKGERLSSHKSN